MRLYVNIDHVATLREARRTDEPDPMHAAAAAERGGAESGHGRADAGVTTSQCESALGGDLLPPLRDECGLKRLHARGDPHDFGRGAKLEVQDSAHRSA